MTEEEVIIAPKPFGNLTAEEWLAYVKDLKEEPEAKSNGLSFKWTKTGKPSLTVRREQKIVSRTELENIAKENNCPIHLLWNHVRDKGDVQIVTLQAEKKK